MTASASPSPDPARAAVNSGCPAAPAPAGRSTAPACPPTAVLAPTVEGFSALDVAEATARAARSGMGVDFELRRVAAKRQLATFVS